MLMEITYAKLSQMMDIGHYDDICHVGIHVTEFHCENATISFDTM